MGPHARFSSAQGTLLIYPNALLRTPSYFLDNVSDVTSRSGDDATEEPTSTWYVTSQDKVDRRARNWNEEKSADKAAEGKRKPKNKDENADKGCRFEILTYLIAWCVLACMCVIIGALLQCCQIIGLFWLVPVLP
ncbi:uncharacterized protein LOC144745743 [Ciona intestinalis]